MAYFQDPYGTPEPSSDDPSLKDVYKNILSGLQDKAQWQQGFQDALKLRQEIPKVAESLARGAIADSAGAIGDMRDLREQFKQKLTNTLPNSVKNLMAGMEYFGSPATKYIESQAPNTEQILETVPRITPTHEGADVMEQMGGVLAPGMGYVGGKFGKKYAELVALHGEDFANKWMNKLTGGLAPDTKANMIAYHGTPHDIQGGFDVNKIGTGEGAQAFGHGMYFAENPEVSMGYKNMNLSNVEKDARKMLESYGNVDDAIEAAKKLREQAVVNNFTSSKNYQTEIINELAKFPRENEGSVKSFVREKMFGKVTPEGNLYKVDIPDEHVATMMDWDKPLGEQSDHVKKALQTVKKKITPEMMDELGGDLNLLFGKDVTPNQFLNTLEIIHPESTVGIGEQWLNEAGVKGIRYFDNPSRLKKEGTSNFVVFDPTDVKILEKNNQPVVQNK